MLSTSSKFLICCSCLCWLSQCSIGWTKRIYTDIIKCKFSNPLILSCQFKGIISSCFWYVSAVDMLSALMIIGSTFLLAPCLFFPCLQIGFFLIAPNSKKKRKHYKEQQLLTKLCMRIVLTQSNPSWIQLKRLN